MALSKRAQQYLNSMERADQWIAGRDEFIDYLSKQHFQASQVLVDVQLNYSGYTLKIKNHNHDFELSFFSKTNILRNDPIEVYNVSPGYLLYFGDHQTAQFNFYINQDGAICIWDGRFEDEGTHIICSSVEIFIEQYALKSELSKQFEHPYYYKLIDEKKFSEICYKRFQLIEECSDDYTQWHGNEEITVENGIFWDTSQRSLHIYGKTESAVKQFIQKLNEQSII